MQTKLTPELLIAAYSQGFFPMPDDEAKDVLWFNPDPRAILPLNGLHVSRSLSKKLRSNVFNYTVDVCFEKVMQHCSDRPDTWINADFKNAYFALYKFGNAHSIEVWHEGELAGGLYGVQIGGAFFAESKFHLLTDASKAAVYFLVDYMKAHQMTLLEVQFLTDHLQTLGVIEISNDDYLTLLADAIKTR